MAEYKKKSAFNKLQSRTRTLIPVGRKIATKPEEQRRFGHEVYQSSQWFQLSSQLKRIKPFCERCGMRGQALYADHIKELKDGGAAFDIANIQILCAPCHGAKTKEQSLDRKWKPLANAIEDRLRLFESGVIEERGGTMENPAQQPKPS
jgi:5-methylcytosine-specific restriction endonuclease McrA